MGVGLHKFGRFPDRTLAELARDAIWAAIHDASIDPRLIDIAYVANCYSGFFTGQHDAIAPIVFGRAGLSGFPMIHVKGGGAAGSIAVHEAVLAVRSGEYRMALALGVEKLYVPGDPAISISAINSSGELTIATQLGLTYVADFSMSAHRLMKQFGWTPEDFAIVAAKSRANAMLNPMAEVHEPMTVGQILAARIVASPLTRPMCTSAAVDGAAAVLICDDRTAARLGLSTSPVVSAASFVGGRYISNRIEDDRPGMLAMHEAARASRAAYERAGVGPDDLELVQVHDSVAPEEMMAYQALGLCPPGAESDLLRSGATQIGGRVPVNTDGGLLARGHPIAASGVAQVVETVLQMRGALAERQVYSNRGRPPRVAAIQNAGAQGGPSADVGVSAVMILTS